MTKLPKYDLEPAVRPNGRPFTYQGKPIHDITEPFPFPLLQKHIENGKKGDCDACQNALALSEYTGKPCHVGPQTALIELEDKCLQGWTSKPMKDVVKIQDHGGKAIAGTYVLNARTTRQGRGRKRHGATATEITTLDQALKDYRAGKVTSKVAMRRRWGWDEHQIENFTDLIGETSVPTETKTRQRVVGPLVKRQNLVIE